jgi:hypothetical protein
MTMTLEIREFYKHANLNDNPFRSNAIHDVDPRIGIWVGYESERRVFEKILRRTRNDQIGNTNFLMIWGDYGTGKSHALLWAHHLIAHKEIKEFASSSFFVQTLKKDSGRFSFAAAMRDDMISKGGLHHDIYSYKDFLESCLHDHMKAYSCDKDSALSRLIPALELRDIAKQILQTKSAEDAKDIVWWQKMSDYEAVHRLTIIVNLFVSWVSIAADDVRCFRKAFYFFIDEIDLLAESSSKEIREVNEMFRHLYDGCPNAFCLVLGFTSTAAEIPLLFPEYVLSRVTKQIELSPMTLDDGKQFVEAIMDDNRVDNKGTKGFFPFEESAVEAIVAQLQPITPRRIVNAMQQALEEIRLLGADPAKGAISRDFLDENDVIEDMMDSFG